MMKRLLMTSALLFAVTVSPLAADMRMVCETRSGLNPRFDLVLPESGEPELTLSVSDETGTYYERPRVLSHVMTRVHEGMVSDPFSTLHVEHAVTDETGRVRIFPPMTYWIDWERNLVWKNFFSLLDMPGQSVVENCVRVDE